MTSIGNIPTTPALSITASAHTQEGVAKSFFNSEQLIKAAISLLRQDRLFDIDILSPFLIKYLDAEPQNMEKDPFLALLWLILNNDESLEKREIAAKLYIEKFPQDKRFEKNYAYIKHPHILLAHKLIESGKWTCANPENLTFYNEQIAGLIAGTVALDIGDVLTTDEFFKIQEKEGSKPDEPIANVVTKKIPNSPLLNPTYRVNKWYCTPQMRQSSLDEFYIAGRREFQNKVMSHYLQDLRSTSSLIQKVFGVGQNGVVAVIGPYGAGKSTFLKEKFQNQAYVQFGLDHLSPYLANNANSRKQDHHFEAMALKAELLQATNSIDCLLTETAAIDKSRLNGLLRNFDKRQKVIFEIAPRDVNEAVERVSARGSSEIDPGSAKTSSIDAQKYRSERIETICTKDNLSYTLYCNPTQLEGKTALIQVATIHDKKLEIAQGQESLFEELKKHI